MAGTLDFLEQQIAVLDKKQGVAQELEAQATEQLATIEATTQSAESILNASQDVVSSTAVIVDQDKKFADLASQMDAGFQQMQVGVEKVSGLKVTTAQAAETLNAPTRENYLESVNNPSVEENEDYFQDQVSIYSQKLRNLRGDTSFLGGLKRMTLEGAVQKRLNQARSNLSAVKQQKISATQVFNAGVNANNLYATNSSAVERALLADNIVKSQGAIKMLESKQTLTLADRQVLQSELSLDAAQLGAFEKEYAYMKERRLATGANMAALQTKLQALSVQTATLKASDSADKQLNLRTEWEGFVRDSVTGDAEQAAVLKANPDPMARDFVNLQLGSVFLAQRGKQGTQDEFAKKALLARQGGVTGMSDQQHSATRLIDQMVNATRTKLNTDFQTAMTTKEGRQNADALEKKLASDQASLNKLDSQAAMYAGALAGIKMDASQAVSAGAIIVPDWTAQLANPDFAYTGNFSNEFKALVQTDEWKAINLGFKQGQPPVAQLKGTLSNITRYMVENGERDVFGRLQFDEGTSKTIDTVSQGLADYYKTVREMNNKSNTGVGSDVLPSFLIRDEQGRPINIENATTFEQLLRFQLRNTSGESQTPELFKDILGTPSTPSQTGAGQHITGI